MLEGENTLIAGFRLRQRAGTDGAGGFGLGCLYDAVSASGQHVSLKLASPQALPAVRIKERNQHPNLVQLIGHWIVNEQGEIVRHPEESLAGTAPTQANTLVIATDLHIGVPLRVRHPPVQGSLQIPTPELLHYLEDIAAAADFLSAPKFIEGMGVVTLCCDMTPSSILLTPQGARLDDLHSSLTSNLATLDEMRSCSAYSAPESIEGQPGSSSSQYSLALTYCHLRTGTPPFPGTALIDIIRARLRNELSLAGLRAEESRVITKALFRNPAERYRSCAEMVRALWGAWRAEA
ncbi:MAG: hypothetical protein JNM56_23715 [Planctomycetia bacterium]|nr:hypothetical protein [Planctomycetia bacterium]